MGATSPRPRADRPGSAPYRDWGIVRVSIRPFARPALSAQNRDPLHGITLERLLTELVEQCGWETLGREVNIRCFTHEPSIPSSLKFLRRTPWAREKVESYYLFVQRRNARQGKSTP
ncbi:MAG: DUF2132 domain-containing protein [Rhodocyclaceae bacterium]|nr:DUF2132 domain-containing protein [Rhodocyclaceae bacterium]